MPGRVPDMPTLQVRTAGRMVRSLGLIIRSRGRALNMGGHQSGMGTRELDTATLEPGMSGREHCRRPLGSIPMRLGLCREA